MTDAAPVPAAEPAPVAPSIVHRAATAVTDAAATGWTFAIGLLPSINALMLQVGIPVLVGLASALMAWGGLAGYQHAMAPTPHMVIQAADPPKAEPVRIMVQPLDGLLARAAAIEAKLDLVLSRLPEVKVVAKRTKTSAVR